MPTTVAGKASTSRWISSREKGVPENWGMW